LKPNRFLLTLFCAIGFIIGHGQNYLSPKLICVKRSGLDTKLTWIAPNETCGPFQKYYIHHSNSKGGPYKIIDSISNYSRTTYTHSPVAFPPISYYYMSSSYNCPGKTSLFSDSFSNDFLPKPNLLSISYIHGRPYPTESKYTATRDLFSITERLEK
jgi:hypothetical protein